VKIRKQSMSESEVSFNPNPPDESDVDILGEGPELSDEEAQKLREQNKSEMEGLSDKQLVEGARRILAELDKISLEKPELSPDDHTADHAADQK
jgi:hypothetical protein